MDRKVFLFWAICVGLALFRVIGSLNYHPSDSGVCIGKHVQGIGQVSGEPERKSSGQVMIISVMSMSYVESSSTDSSAGIASHTCDANISIRIKTALYPRFKFGDIVSFEGSLGKPFNFSSQSGRSFDYRGYLAKDDIFYEIKSGTVHDTEESVSSVPSYSIKNIPDELSGILFALRRSFVAHLEYALGEPHAALAAGLVVGEKSALGKDLLDDFRTVGLIHIVVLSGYNITIVGDALRRMLSFLPRVWGIVVGGIGIVLFGILVGGGATVVRSCVMAGIALTANMIRRDYQVSRALVFAGLMMLIQSPMILLHDPSFQLSFLATLGLILLASPIESKLGFIPEKFGMRGIVASTIATQIFVSPYILYMMGQISLIGMFVNIIVLPCIPLTMLLVACTGALGFIWSGLSIISGWGAHFLLSYELYVVQHAARFPFASLHIPPFSGWWTVLFYTLFFLVYAIVAYRKQYNLQTNTHI
ncbi:MAG: ComEC/Rec2 family competence protein [Candidatus Taylorbacteria bacterium]